MSGAGMSEEKRTACANCRFFDRDAGDENTGECHRYAPSVRFYRDMQAEIRWLETHDDPSLANLSHWPDVGPSDWCGEFEIGERC